VHQRRESFAEPFEKLTRDSPEELKDYNISPSFFCQEKNDSKITAFNLPEAPIFSRIKSSPPCLYGG
jgi:hypothetical protein